MQQPPLIQPPLITYNLKERGRQYRGKERNFNIPKLCASINGGATQERVSSRGMLGYFGHLPRQLAGLEPVESLVIDGRYNELDHAVVTTYLKAYQDGTIEHKTEFLDTVSGRKASNYYHQKIGGFSSAIDQILNDLYGFDYVVDANYLTNIGYALDSAGLVLDSANGALLTMDQIVAALRREEEESLLAIINRANTQIAQLAHALDSSTTENEELLSILASKGAGNAALDSVATLPISVSLDSVNRMRRDTELFRQTATLPVFIQPLSRDQDQAQDQYNTLISRIRWR